MLEISGLSAKYGAVVALADVTLSVERGQIVSLLGSNGAGKSTLLGCVTNSVPCRMTGSIKLEGAEISGLPTDAIIAPKKAAVIPPAAWRTVMIASAATAAPSRSAAYSRAPCSGWSAKASARKAPAKAKGTSRSAPASQ